jgi:uncharacterized membrane protein YbhN (UPF0104 family)
VSKTQRLGISLALLAWLAWRTDWGQVTQAFAGLRWGLWAAAVGLYLVTQVVSGFRWQLLARPLGFRQPLRHFVGYYFIGMFWNLFLPTSMGGDVVRAWYLAAGGAGRRVEALLSVLADRLSGLALLVLLACGGSLYCSPTLPRWIPWSVWGCAAGLGLGAALLPFLAWWAPPSGPVERLTAGVRLYGRRPVLLLVTAGLAFFVQAANIVLVWLVGLALRLDEVPVPAAHYWVLVPMVTLLTLAPVSLNGMGIREWGTVLFLAPLGVNRGLALSLSFLWFAVFTAAAVCGGAVYLFGRFPRPEVSSTHEPLRGDPDQGRARQPRTAA